MKNVQMHGLNHKQPTSISKLFHDMNLSSKKTYTPGKFSTYIIYLLDWSF